MSEPLLTKTIKDFNLLPVFLQYAGINIGPVHKRDVMKASAMLEHDPQYVIVSDLLLCFTVLLFSFPPQKTKLKQIKTDHKIEICETFRIFSVLNKICLIVFFVFMLTGTQ